MTEQELLPEEIWLSPIPSAGGVFHYSTTNHTGTAVKYTRTPSHLDASPLGPEELLPCLFGCAAQLDEHEGKTCSGHYTSQVRCSSGCEVAGAVGWGHTRDEANEKAIESWHARQGAANGN